MNMIRINRCFLPTKNKKKKHLTLIYFYLLSSLEFSFFSFCISIYLCVAFVFCSIHGRKAFFLMKFSISISLSLLLMLFVYIYRRRIWFLLNFSFFMYWWSLCSFCVAKENKKQGILKMREKIKVYCSFNTFFMLLLFIPKYHILVCISFVFVFVPRTNRKLYAMD